MLQIDSRSSRVCTWNWGINISDNNKYSLNTARCFILVFFKLMVTGKVNWLHRKQTGLKFYLIGVDGILVFLQGTCFRICILSDILVIMHTDVRPC